MHDGIQLAANIFLPKKGGPFPVILIRTPYGKMDEKSGEAKRYCASGYAMVAQDCRGRGSSQGVWDPFAMTGKTGLTRRSGLGGSLVQRPYRHLRWVLCWLDAMGRRSARQPLSNLHGASRSVQRCLSRDHLSGGRVSAFPGVRLGRGRRRA
jgi:hypothetical protein